MWLYYGENGKWLVGFYLPSNKFKTIVVYENENDAAAYVHYLNGGNDVLTI